MNLWSIQNENRGWVGFHIPGDAMGAYNAMKVEGRV
tara:strand:- start:1221 stop:1328 length:108 start_codon:yes stop_codon:yes gene_type:complete